MCLGTFGNTLVISERICVCERAYVRTACLRRCWASPLTGGVSETLRCATAEPTLPLPCKETCCKVTEEAETNLSNLNWGINWSSCPLMLSERVRSTWSGLQRVINVRHMNWSKALFSQRPRSSCVPGAASKHGTGNTSCSHNSYYLYPLCSKFREKSRLNLR